MQLPEPLQTTVTAAISLDVLAERGRLANWRRSVSTGRPTLLYESGRSERR
jgi:hypothetical protein